MMRIKCKFIIGIVLIVLMLNVGLAYGQGNEYTDSQGRFSFNLPAGWKATTPYNSAQAAYFTYSIQQGITGEFAVIIIELSNITSIEQFADELENIFKQDALDYIPGTKLPTTIFGLPAVKMNYSFSRQAGETLQAEAYMFISGNFVYTIILIALPDYFAQLQPGFTQAVASFKVQSSAPVAVQPTPQPVVPSTPVPTPPTTTPVPSTPSMPVQPPVTAGVNIYADPQGGFSIPIPTGSTTAQITEIGVVLNTPDGAVIMAWYCTPGEQYVQGIVDQIKPNQQFHGQSQLQAGSRQAVVELYSEVNPQDNVNYATLIVTYPGTPFMIIVTVPADKYNQAQTWITEMIKGTSIS